MSKDDETHARGQSKANAAMAVRMGEEDALVAAALAIAYALLDIADAIREPREAKRDDR